MTLREKVFAKYGGRCAYTGKPLDDDWQIDHATPKNDWHKTTKDCINSLDNLLPCLKIINHYKRAKNLEDFRKYISTLQSRIDKMPKWINGERGKAYEIFYKNEYKPKMRMEDAFFVWRQARYIKQVAELFGITPETPFSGKFYFEVCDGEID